MGALTGKVAIVTGASRGIGRGIALVLAEQGATVYITGRTVNPGEHYLPGTVGETAAQCTERGAAEGGKGIAVACDHGNDEQVAIARDRRHDIGRDGFLAVGRDYTISIVKDRIEEVGNHRRDKTTANHWTEVGGHLEQRVEGHAHLQAAQEILHRTKVYRIQVEDEVVRTPEPPGPVLGQEVVEAVALGEDVTGLHRRRHPSPPVPAHRPQCPRTPRGSSQWPL